MGVNTVDLNSALAGASLPPDPAALNFAGWPDLARLSTGRDPGPEGPVARGVIAEIGKTAAAYTARAKAA
jgi:hypothetical protein